MMSRKVIGAMGDSPFRTQLTNGLNRLADYLPERVKTDQLSSLSRMTIITDGTSEVSEETWSTILEALRHNRALSFTYKAPLASQSKKKVFHPYQLVSYRGLWYLIGFNPEINRIVNYSTIRIMDLVLLKERFELLSDIKIEDYIDPEMGMYISEEKYNVKIYFYKWVAPYVSERIWHRTQKIIENDDGSIMFEFQTNQLVQTAQWIMSWGDGALVIEPDELKQKIMDTVQNMTKQYEGGKNGT